METKYCSGCDDDRPVDEFNWKNKDKGVRYHVCKVCWNKQNKARYEKNKQYYIDKASTRKTALRQDVTQKLYEYFMEHPCVDCPEKDPVVLTFDHVRGKKTASIADLVSRGYSWEAILKEIAKCEVRCFNCHMRRTARENSWVIWEIASKV